MNDAPTLDPIPDPPLLAAEQGTQTVTLAGMVAGGGEVQNLELVAVSSDPDLLPHPTNSYTSPATQGAISFTPAANAAGQVVITVTVKDDGGTANGGADTSSRQFTVSMMSQFQRYAASHGLATDQPRTAHAIFLITLMAWKPGPSNRSG